jgi:uncharacterized damage-inducible protein DinB
MSTKEISGLIRKMKSVYQGDPWYGEPIKKVLQDIDAEKVFNKPIPQAHSMAELLTHIISWRELLNKRLHGDDSFSVRQKESFDWKRIDPDPKTAWENLKKALEINQQQIIDGLEQANDDLLKQKVAKRKYNYRYLIKGLIQHDIYHLGQIALLKKNDL